MTNWFEKLFKIEKELHELEHLLENSFSENPSVDERKVNKRIKELLKEREKLARPKKNSKNSEAS